MGENVIQRKAIKLSTIIFIIYCCVASGAFGIEDMVGEAGPGMTLLLLIIVPIVWALPLGLASAELGSVWPDTAGAISWTERLFGRYCGFHDGWMYAIGCVADLAIYLVWIYEYAEWFLGELSFIQKLLLLFVVTIVIGYINIRGIESIGVSLTIFTVIIIIPFIVLTVLGFLNWNFNPTVPFIPEGQSIWGSFSTALLIGIWMYSGYDSMAFFAGEVKNAKKLIPRALLIASPIIVISYILPTVAGLASVGQWAQWTTEGNGLTFVEIGAQVGGPILGFLFYIAVTIGSVSIYTEELGAGTRTTYFMARRNLFFKSFGKLHKKYNTPYIGIIITGLIALVLALFCSFTVLVILESCLLWIYYMFLFLAAYIRRKKYPDIQAEYTIPVGKKLLFIMMLVPAIIITYAILNEELVYILVGVLLNVTTPIFYFIFKKIYGEAKNMEEVSELE